MASLNMDDSQRYLQQQVEIRTLTGGAKSLSRAVVEDFRFAFRGAVLRPTDPDFDEARRIWNAMIDRRPALIARCTGTTDVVNAVRLACEHELLVSIRGGGHNISGLAVCEGGLMLDLSGMKEVAVEPARNVARAQAGCRLGDLDRATQLHGLATVLGFVSETGIGGLTVGGGFGYLTRRFGWTCDNLVSMEVVTADGTVVRAAGNENEDLFWALRGGGGNFGVVTSFEYRLHPVGPEIVGGAIAWRAEEAPAVLRLFRDLTRTAPRELTCVATLRTAPPASWLPEEIHGQPIVAMFICHTGRPEDGEALVAQVKRFGKPVADGIVRRSYVQMQSLIDATQPKGRRYYWKSEYLPDLEPGLLDGVIAQASRVPSPHSAILLFHIGGALNELPPGHSPAGNRDAAYVLNIMGSWEHAADDEANVRRTRECWRALRSFSTGGVYINFLTEEEGADRIAAAYGQKALQRLASIKQKYDPLNLFRHTKNITFPIA